MVFVAGFLVLGYFLYGALMDRAIRPDPARPTPAYTQADGVDYVPMATWRVYLIQLLNIAGLGPVFGPIMGALWGPQVFLWILFGGVMGGAVHDYLSGAMSVRRGGASLPELIAHYLGRKARHFAVFFILVLMVLVGTVFVKGPAALLVSILPAETVAGWFGADPAALTTEFQGVTVWQWVVMGGIFLYYVLATLLPIDKIIGQLYPFFAACLLVMVVGLAAAMALGTLRFPDFTLENLHPKEVPAWPIIFITVSCGAISGFHATQSPLMARCIKSERRMRLVFFGAMIAESAIAMIWAAAPLGYYGGTEGLAAALGPKLNNATVVVHTVSTEVLGKFGGVLAVLGVVVLPITSGDTAFRAGRLILSDYLRLPQTRIRNRYALAIPLFAVSLGLMFMDFGIVWRYFGWANQTLAVVTLWAGAVFLARRRRAWWLAVAPAVFMTVVTVTYLLVERRENGCFGLDHTLGTAIGLVLGVLSLALFLWVRPRLAPESDETPVTPQEEVRPPEDVAI